MKVQPKSSCTKVQDCSFVFLKEFNQELCRGINFSKYSDLFKALSKAYHYINIMSIFQYTFF